MDAHFPPETPTITFHSEDLTFSLDQANKIEDWIKSTIQQENQTLAQLNFIFCSDAYLHRINVDYLQHDTLTDVITFPYSESSIEGDIFISIDRIRENANAYDVSFQHELSRVMIHGVLHLMGYGDKTAEEKQQMTKKENQYLGLLFTDGVE